MNRLVEHGLLDAGVEAANVDPRCWQAARLRSVGSASRGSAHGDAALCFPSLSLCGGSFERSEHGSSVWCASLEPESDACVKKNYNKHAGEGCLRGSL